MITLEHDRLVFRFPEVHDEATCSLHFQRTLRIPDDGWDYPLPPGLGAFPLRHLDDYARRLPEKWLARGGVIMPMHQAEAMWVSFDNRGWDESYPFAIKIATGKINAITGESWDSNLNQDPQDYAVIPKQPWLDGYCVERGVIRQFVAMPLGKGYSAEEQITGTAEHGGMQIIAYPMKAERYEATKRRRPEVLEDLEPNACMSERMDMGLAPGGRMKQKIYEDPYGLDAWDQRHASRCFVTIANSKAWMAITGQRPPTTPPTASDYTKAGLPWFEYFDGDAEAISGATTLRSLSSVHDMDEKKRTSALPENESVNVENLAHLRKKGSTQVKEMPA